MILLSALLSSTAHAQGVAGWSHGGTSTGCAFTTVQGAIDAAPASAQVFVRPSTVDGDGATITKALTLRRGNLTCDGDPALGDPPATLRRYAGGSVVDVDTPAAVVLRDLVIENGVAPAGGGNLRLAADSAVDVKLCEIRNGQASVTRQGGNVWIGSGAVVEFTDTVIDGGTVSLFAVPDEFTQHGGNVYIDAGANDADVRFVRGEISNGAAGRGGGIYAWKAFVQLWKTNVRLNAAVDGGGIYSVASTTRLTGNAKVQNNDAQGQGGGVAVIGGTLEVLPAVRVRWNDGATGGGLYVADFEFDGVEDLYYPAPVVTLPASAGQAVIRANLASGGGGVAVDVRLQGATVTGGHVTLNSASSLGGAVYVAGPGSIDLSSPRPVVTLADMRWEGNDAEDGGGAAFANIVEIDVSNTLVHDNHATADGGGLAILSGDAGVGLDVDLLDVQVTNNSADGRGGGLFANMTVTTIEGSDCGSSKCAQISDNTATVSGGAIHAAADAVVDVLKTLMRDNSSGAGNLAFVEAGGDLTLNTVLSTSDNASPDLVSHGELVVVASTLDGQDLREAVVFEPGSDGSFVSTILFEAGSLVNDSGGALRADCSLVTTAVGTWSGGFFGSLYDPLFVDPLNGDYHLATGSDAIDRCTFGGAIDLDGTPRPQGTLWDIGVFEAN